MIEQRLAVLYEIDRQAKSIALEFVKGKLISESIIKTIIELYSSAQVERVLKDDHFEAAYHATVTGEVEFLISRILYHYSINNNLEWKIYLRRQKEKVAPDIRIEIKNKTISIIEIKARGSWIQPFLSSERYKNDKRKLANGHTFDPDEMIKNQRNQLAKYMKVFDLTKSEIFYLLPTLDGVHRLKYESKLNDYFNYFGETSQIPKENFILLSTNMVLNLGCKPDLNNLQPTDYFEGMIHKISNTPH